MRFSTKPANPPNLCLECNEPVRRPRRLHEHCQEAWNSRPAFSLPTDRPQQRTRPTAVTAEALE